MDVIRRRALFVLSAVLTFGCVAAAEQPAEEYHYAIEINGTLCGYSTVQVWPSELDGRTTTLQKQKIFLMLSALGMEFDTELLLTHHLDPATGQFVSVEGDIEQARTTRHFSARVEGTTARVVSMMKAGEQVIELTPETILPGPLYFPHLKRDFVEQDAAAKTYPILEVVEGEVQESEYTRVANERLELDGKVFETVVLDTKNLKTGVKTRQWIERATAQLVKAEFPGGREIYLADPLVSKRIELANLDEGLFAETNVTIGDVLGISYMKVRATIEPTGLVLTPEALNVPGQRFEGTVRDNRIEGVFEIEHPRYDGAGAPAFPPDFSNEASLAPYLEPSGLIESTDAVLVEQARKITEGAADSWEAATRIARWVSENIDYAIPGGGTSRKTFDTRTGECGAHSNLVAALARAVGIPARVVWGCMYVPHHGGAFGQHGWNEVYMGQAGWIPLDATANETDYVDSGHIRIGVHEVAASALNPIAFEVLEHRVGAEQEEATDTAAYDRYVGEYANEAAGRVFKVVAQNGALAVDIPGQMVVALHEPDEQGRWFAKISPSLYFTFESLEDGPAAVMAVHEIVRMQRIRDAAAIPEGVPERLKSHLGVYLLAQLNAEFEVIYADGRLAVVDPLQKLTVGLRPPDETGGWLDEFGKNTLRFDEDGEGGIRALLVDAATRFER